MDKPPDPDTENIFDLMLRRIEEDRAFNHARFLKRLLAEPTESSEITLEYLTMEFDIRSFWNSLLVMDFQAVDLYFKPLLDKLAESTKALGESLIILPNSNNRTAFFTLLAVHLAARKSHWTSEALKRARKITQGTAEEGETVLQSHRRFGPALPPNADPKTPPITPIEDQSDPAAQPEPKAEEIQRRAALLSDYKAATGKPSNKRIYESRNSGLHKPEFYSWRSGDLHEGSATCINFERFLKLKKPPIPRKPKP
jgi:hypothetical protein